MSVLLLCYRIVTIYPEFFDLWREAGVPGKMLAFNGLQVGSRYSGALTKK
jgi:hypothetical protein